MRELIGLRRRGHAAGTLQQRHSDSVEATESIRNADADENMCKGSGHGLDGWVFQEGRELGFESITSV